MNKKIGSTIKKIRELKDITREALASKLGITVSALAKVERGESEITISRLYQIAQMLKVGVNELLEFDVAKVFNISNNQIVQGAGADEVNLTNHISPHTEKYIAKLEQENEKLKNEIASIKSTKK